jgi:hypothetical protein
VRRAAACDVAAQKRGTAHHRSAVRRRASMCIQGRVCVSSACPCVSIRSRSRSRVPEEAYYFEDSQQHQRVECVGIDLCRAWSHMVVVTVGSVAYSAILRAHRKNPCSCSCACGQVKPDLKLGEWRCSQVKSGQAKPADLRLGERDAVDEPIEGDGGGEVRCEPCLGVVLCDAWV